MTSSATDQFSSEGFDLDAVSAAADDVVFEIGGGISAAPNDDSKDGGDGGDSEKKAEKEKKEKEKEKEDPCAASEAHKAEGNAHFKAGEYLDAYDCYTSAVRSCPGPFDGEELLRRRDEFDRKERDRVMGLHRAESERRRKIEEESYRRKREGRKEKDQTSDDDDGKAAADENDDDDEQRKKDEAEKRPAEFRPPPHPHGKKLSVYHCNRAACSLQLGRHEESADDCSVAILLERSYVKAYLRRMAAYERMMGDGSGSGGSGIDKTEEALNDARKALFYDPNNANARRNVRRLERMEAERTEKLKEETMGKLKDLGNSILGNFGMSLDNFKTQKDPNTGGYSISFQQNG